MLLNAFEALDKENTHITAVELKRKVPRFKKKIENCWPSGSGYITTFDATQFVSPYSRGAFNQSFDVVFIDAPCSVWAPFVVIEIAWNLGHQKVCGDGGELYRFTNQTLAELQQP